MKTKFGTKQRILLIFCFAIFTTGSCDNEDESYIQEIPGEYSGYLTYWNPIDGSGVSLHSNDPSIGDKFKTTIKKAGSNYILSFDKSFSYSIPDITVEITPTKNSDIFAITTIPGQAYNSVIHPNTYMNLPSNYFAISKYPQKVDCYLGLRSNNPDSTYLIEISVIRIY